MKYFIELNGRLIYMYKSYKRAFNMANNLANTNNVVRVWSDGIVVYEPVNSLG